MSNRRILFGVDLLCQFVIHWYKLGRCSRQYNGKPHSQLLSTSNVNPILTRRQIGGWSVDYYSARYDSTESCREPVQAKKNCYTPIYGWPRIKRRCKTIPR
jgi:hypothetical protein